MMLKYFPWPGQVRKESGKNVRRKDAFWEIKYEEHGKLAGVGGSNDWLLRGNKHP